MSASAHPRDSTVSGPASGPSSHASFAYYDPDSSSWRTYQNCLIEGWDEFSATWPRSGLMRNGRAYRLRPLVPPISGIGCSYVPTPTASGFGVADVPRLLARRAACKVRHRNGAGFGLTFDQWVKVQRHEAGLSVSGSVNPTLYEMAMGLPEGWTDCDDEPSAMP